MVSGKCYQSNKKATIKFVIRVISYAKKTTFPSLMNTTKASKKKYKTSGKSWYENEQRQKKGTSWKSRLQFDIDRMIKQSKDWDEFLKKMTELSYEIKYSKHIAFKPKDKSRFTRSKTIEEDYIEERLKERIAKNGRIKTPIVKKHIGNIIDMNTNVKVKKKAKRL